MESKAHLIALVADIEARPDDMDCQANSKRVLSRIMDGRSTADPALRT